MSIYISDITTFSDNGFNSLNRDYFESKQVREIVDIETSYLQGKGLRYVPRTSKILHNIVAKIIESNNLLDHADLLGIYNTNDVSNLEACIDFDIELSKFGVNLVNPMKVASTLNGSIIGWVAIRNKLNNICLTIHTGRCGLFSAISNILLDFKDNQISYAIVLGAHFMGEDYFNYNHTSKFNKEIGYGLLLTNKISDTAKIEILECETSLFDQSKFNQWINENENVSIVDSNDDISDTSQIYNIIDQYSFQTSFFPFFINNYKSYPEIMHRNTINYITIDGCNFMSNLKCKLL